MSVCNCLPWSSVLLEFLDLYLQSGYPMILETPQYKAAKTQSRRGLSPAWPVERFLLQREFSDQGHYLTIG